MKSSIVAACFPEDQQKETIMNERNARDEDNTQYSVPPVFSEKSGWNSPRNEIRNPSNGSAERKNSKSTKPGGDEKNNSGEGNHLQK
jgi:hypothetical protein